MKMNLLTFYESILNLGGFSVDSDGMISTALTNPPTPANLHFNENGEDVVKRLVMPTQEQLTLDGGWENRVVFHPLRENVLNGESKTIQHLRKGINFRVNAVIGALMHSILSMGIDPNSQKKPSGELIKLLGVVPDVDQTMIKNFKRLLNKISNTNTRDGFVSIYLKKGGKIDNKVHTCVGIINFPWYEAIKEAVDEKEFHDVKLRQKDFTAFIKLMEYIIPDINDASKWMYGVQQSTSPFTETLLRTTELIVEPLNKYSDLIFNKTKYLSEAERKDLYNLCYFDLSFKETLDDLDSLLAEVKMIPMQEGNEGSIPVKELERQAAQIQQQANPNTQTKGEEMHNWETISAPVNQAQPQQSQQPQQMQQPQYQQPMQQQSQMPQQTANNGDGIDFQQLMQNRQQMMHHAQPMPQVPAYPNQMPNGQLVGGNWGNPQPGMMPQMPPQGYPNGYQQPPMPPQGMNNGWQSQPMINGGYQNPQMMNNGYPNQMQYPNQMMDNNYPNQGPTGMGRLARQQYGLNQQIPISPSGNWGNGGWNR